MVKKNTISKATLGRLPIYLRYLKNISCEFISSATMARDLSLGEVQVRKDLNIVSGVGKPKIGYLTTDLIQSIEKCLGAGACNNAVLIGAGKLGRALLNYKGFEEFGVKIIAAFDNDKTKVDEKESIYIIDDFETFCEKNGAQIGIIAVGASSAQEVCDLMIKNNVKAIWNFAPCKLNLSNDVVFIQENLALSLAYLNNQLMSKFLGGNNEI